MNIFFPPNQEQIFVAMLIFGVFIGLFYDLFKIKRHIFGSTSFIVFVDDVFFSVSSVAVFLMTIFIVNNGIFRWFEVFFSVVGFAVYRLSLSRMLLRFSFTVADAAVFVVRQTAHLLLSPVICVFRFLDRFLFTPTNLMISRQMRLHKITSSFNRLTKSGKCTYEK